MHLKNFGQRMKVLSILLIWAFQWVLSVQPFINENILEQAEQSVASNKQTECRFV